MKLETAGLVNDTASSANPILANHPTNTAGVVTSDDDPEAARRTLVQKCMKDPALNAKEK